MWVFKHHMFRKEGESMNWNEMVSDLMKKKGVNQKQLSKLSGITKSSISRYLKSDKTPRMDVVVNISKALQVETDYFIIEKSIVFYSASNYQKKWLTAE